MGIKFILPIVLAGEFTHEENVRSAAAARTGRKPSQGPVGAVMLPVNGSGRGSGKDASTPSRIGSAAQGTLELDAGLPSHAGLKIPAAIETTHAILPVFNRQAAPVSIECRGERGRSQAVGLASIGSRTCEHGRCRRGSGKNRKSPSILLQKKCRSVHRFAWRQRPALALISPSIGHRTIRLDDLVRTGKWARPSGLTCCGARHSPPACFANCSIRRVPIVKYRNRQ